jgi:predicted nucleic acid-binding protein
MYQAVRCGEMTRKEAERQLEYVRGLRIRLLGDRVLQDAAWKAAVLLGWPDTFDAEYVALTQFHADALITLDRQLANAVKDIWRRPHPSRRCTDPSRPYKRHCRANMLICRNE